MHPLEKKIHTILRKNKLITPKGETIVVAVSGGPDSICLLHLLAHLSVSLNLTLVTAYVNHGLRPEESGREVEVVKKSADLLQVVCECGEVNVANHARANKLSIEQAARELRFAFLKITAEKHSATKIALAHTADDQAEEILMRLIRGSGKKGLSGMSVMRQGLYIRPFLTTLKKDLLDYLEHFKIDFVIDSSNKERKYLRNRIRLDLIPYLAREFNPNIQKTLLQVSTILQDEEALLAKLTSDTAKEILLFPDHEQDNKIKIPENIVVDASPDTPPAIFIDLHRFLRQPLAMKRRILETAILKMESSPKFKQIEQILFLTDVSKPGNIVHLHKGLRVLRTKDGLYFFYPMGKTSRRGNLIPDQEHPYFETIITGLGEWKVEELNSSFEFDYNNAPPTDQDKKDRIYDFLDFDLVNFPMTLRSLKPGDRFQPLGSEGHKKISKFLIDKKIPKKNRWQVPVLVSDGTIVALLGLQIHHCFRMTDKTKGVLRVKIK